MTPWIVSPLSDTSTTAPSVRSLHHQSIILSLYIHLLHCFTRYFFSRFFCLYATCPTEACSAPMQAFFVADETVPLCHRQQARFAPYHLSRGGGSRHRRANHTDNFGDSSESHSGHSSRHNTRSETIADRHGSDENQNPVPSATTPRPGLTYTNGQLLGLRFMCNIWSDQAARIAELPLPMRIREPPPPYHALSPPPPAFEAHPPPPTYASTECQTTRGARGVKRTGGGRTTTDCISSSSPRSSRRSSRRMSQGGGGGGDGATATMDEEQTTEDMAACRITLPDLNPDRRTRPPREPAAHTPRQTRSARHVRTSPQGGGPPRMRGRRKAVVKTRTV